MQHITATQLHTLIDNTEKPPLLLDVREVNEFEYCHIKGSLLMPMQSIPQRIAELPKDQTIVTICHHGMRSQQVALFLLQNGFTEVINLTGGINAWATDVDNAMPRY